MSIHAGTRGEPSTHGPLDGPLGPWLREPNTAPNSNSKNMGTKLKFKMRAHEDVIDGCAFLLAPTESNN